MVNALFGTLPLVVAAAASKCEDTTVFEGERFDLQRESWGENTVATAVSLSGKVWVASAGNGTSTFSMCKTNGQCISKRASGYSDEVDRIAVDELGSLPVVWMKGKYGLSKCDWDENAEEIYCKPFFGKSHHPVIRKASTDTEFALDGEGNIFVEDLFQTNPPVERWSQSALWKCSPSGETCELFGCNFWDEASDIYNIVTDSQGNVYVSFSTRNSFDHRFAKCSPSGSCEEVTFSDSEEGDSLQKRNFVVGLDDNVYCLTDNTFADDYDEPKTVVLQCSAGSGCTRVLSIPRVGMTMSGLTDRYTYSVGRDGDLYAVRSWAISHGHFGETEQLDVVRRCFTSFVSQTIEIQV